MTRHRRGPSKLFWKLFLGYALLVTVALVASALFTLREFERFYDVELTEHLRVQAVTLRSQVRGRLDSANLEELTRIAREVGGRESEGIRVTFIAADGMVLGDSQANAHEMESHYDRAEIQSALEEGWGASTRWSETLSRMLKYVAVRVGTVQDPEGVVRVALGVQTIGNRTQSVRTIMWTIVVIALLTTAAFAVVLARLWTMPIRRITAIAGRISKGDLSARARVRGSDEVTRLARSLNEMGDSLSHQLATIDGHRLMLETLLNQLAEGIIVAEANGRIVLANPAAMRLLESGLEGQRELGSWAGLMVEQCVPQHDLQRLLLPRKTNQESGKLGQDDAPAAQDYLAECETRVELQTGTGSVVALARASDLVVPAKPADGAVAEVGGRPRAGRILALTDITEVARTMQIKTDFVANASHELRTPLSAMRGAIETLLGIEMTKDPEAATRFLGIVARHSARLEALVADLLSLSKLESSADKFKATQVDWHAFCRDLTERWADDVAKRQIQWVCDAPPDLREVTVDAQSLRLALDNLVGNAIKFTNPGGHVAVTSKREGCEIIIEVADDGCGIPVEEQERVFERFYQVSTARSGTGSELSETRGTGLGLSIVRHAVAAMKGRVTLTSEPGSGTSVVVTLGQPHRE